jgi:putative nucleotidyltransferase with HDIG domain
MISSKNLKIGDIISTDIVINNDMTIEDKDSTKLKREQALINIIPIYEFYSDAKGKTIRRMNSWLEFFRKSRQDYYRNKNDRSNILKNFKENCQNNFGIEIENSEIASLLKSRDIYTLLDINSLFKYIEELYNSGIILSKSETPKSNDNQIQVIEKDKSRRLINLSKTNDLQDIKNQLKRQIKTHNISEKSSNLLTGILIRFFGINYSYSQSLTHTEKQVILDKTLPVMHTFKRGKVILRKGDEVKKEDLRILDIISSAKKKDKKIPLFYLIFISLTFIFYSISLLFKKWKSSELNRNKLLIVSSITLMLGALAYKASLFLFPLILRNIPFSMNFNLMSITFAIPFGAIALITAFIFDLQSSIIISFVNSIIGAMICNWDLSIFLYILIGNLMICFSIESYNKLRRSTIFKSGFFILLPVNLLLVIFLVISKTGFNVSLMGTDLFMGASSALLSALIASFIIPAWEIIFKLITDLKLSELSNLNSSVFRELLEKAPGTYHHSQMVASLSEAAAVELNLSAPLLTAMALYHDIGKIDNPQFFTENNTIYKNPHEQLSPDISAKHIIAHISEGYEKASKLNLPDLIKDAILEHHGTKLVKYFYDKAVKQSLTDTDEFDENHYKYPGPKPGSIETAIIMLADQVEAATRSLESYTSENIKKVIQEIITSDISEGQFDDCKGLTFKALNTIANSFLRKLSSIYHRRISYPGFEFEGKENEIDQNNKEH